MDGGAMDTIDARQRRQRQRQQRDVRNGRDGRRRMMSNGRGDTTIKKMTIKKRQDDQTPSENSVQHLKKRFLRGLMRICVSVYFLKKSQP